MAKTTIPAGYFAAGSIATADIADSAIQTAHITDAHITTAKLADDAITAAKIDSTATGMTFAGVTSNKDSINIQMQSSTGTSQIYQKFINDGGNSFIGLASSTGAGLLSNAGAYSLNIQTESARNLAFGTNNTLRMLIDGTSGNVGIGSTSPSQLLTVNAADGVLANEYVAAFVNAEATDGESFGVNINAGSNSNDIALNITTHDGGTVLGRLRGDGRLTLPVAGAGVGIGTASPLEALHVNGNLLLNDADPRIFLQTGSTHYNWKISAQDAIDGGLEISSGGSTDADATDDTYTQRLVIKRDGYVGVHTTSPTVPFHVINNFAGAVTRLDQTGTGGGNHGLEVRCASTSSWATQIRTGSGSGTLQFGVTGSVVYVNDRLGVGTSSPNSSRILELKTSTNHYYPYQHVTGSSTYYMGFGNSSYHHHFQSGGSTGFYWGSAGYFNGGAHTYSDERLKENITTIDGALDKVALMNGVTFDWIDTDLRGSGKQFGVTAQNMLEVDAELPKLVEDAEASQEDIDNEELDTQYYAMDYARLTPFFIEAIKELKTKLEAAEARIATLES